MDVLEAIKTRRSIAALTDEVPSRELVEQVVAAGVEGPNHYATQPWRFIVLTGKAREEFGEVQAQAVRERMAAEDEKKLDGLMLSERAKPLRAPVLIVVGVKHKANERLREDMSRLEDIAAVSAAVQNMLLAAHGLGLAAHWRSGDGIFDARVKDWFGLAPEDDIVAVIYLGYRDAERDVLRIRSHTWQDKTEWRGWD